MHFREKLNKEEKAARIRVYHHSHRSRIKAVYVALGTVSGVV